MAKLPIISQDKFRFSVDSVEQPIHILFTRFNEKVISGFYRVGKTKSAKSQTQFYLRAKARRPMVWVKQGGKNLVLDREIERQVQQFTKDLVTHWVSNRSIQDNPHPKNHKELSEAEGIYISQLLKIGHLRRPCVKRRRKNGANFLCHATIVNMAKIQNVAQLEEIKKMRDKLNLLADSYAELNNLEAGSFGDYMRRSFSGF